MHHELITSTRYVSLDELHVISTYREKEIKEPLSPEAAPSKNDENVH